QRRVRRLQAEVELAWTSADKSPPAAAAAAESSLWRPAWMPTAAERSAGFPAPLWRVTPTSATWLSGGNRDLLYFAFPLTDDLEVHCRRPAATWRELRPLYGGVVPELAKDGAALR